MTLLAIDGFDLQDYAMRYTTLVLSGAIAVSSTTPYSSGYSIACSKGGTGAAGYAQPLVPVTASATVTVGAAINTAGGATVIGFWTDSAGTGQCFIQLTASGTIQAYRGSPIGGSNTLLATSAAGSYIVSTWCFVEVTATISATVGSISVSVNGVNVLNLTGINNKQGGTSSNIDAISFGIFGGTSAFSATFDDLYVLNSLGSANNAPLGTCQVQTILPTGAGSSTQFAPTGSASNYANVNDVPDNTATYNSDNLVGHRDTYAAGDLVSGSTTIFGVQQVMHGKDAGAGASKLKAAQKSGATISYGATRTMAAASSAFRDLFETNPATGVAYTQSEINALEIGAEIAS